MLKELETAFLAIANDIPAEHRMALTTELRALADLRFVKWHSHPSLVACAVNALSPEQWAEAHLAHRRDHRRID